MKVDEFPVLRLGQGMFQARESLGTKEKSWVLFPEGKDAEPWLFKEPRLEPGKMEHLAEKIAQEVADCLGLPCARVELATLDGTKGSVSKTVLQKGEILVHGNEVIAGFVDGYDQGAGRSSRAHSFDRICRGLSGFCGDNGAGALAQFAGFLTFDALIGNTDRHHQNWAIIVGAAKTSRPPRLAPSFDHASSLGRELRDERRLEILAGNGMEDYVRRGKGSVYLGEDHGALSPIALVEALQPRFPALFDPWLAALESVTEDRMDRIMGRLPVGWVSQPQREFAKELVLESKRILGRLR